MLYRVVKVVAAAGAAWLMGGAHAATLQISPVMIDLQPGANASGLTLRNSGDKPIYGQVRVYRWSQADGDDKLTPTQEVVASPPIVEIGAQSEQLVRLVRTSAPQGAEQSYRVLIDELPQPDAAPVNGVAIRLRYSVPVFLEPDGGAGGSAARDPKLAWHLQHGDAGWTLAVDNAGARRAQIAGVQIVDEAGKAIDINKGLLGYALAGSGRQWQLPDSVAAGLNGPLKVRAAINTVQTEASVMPR